MYTNQEARIIMTKNKLNEIFKRLYAGIQSRRDEKDLLESEEVNSLMEDQWNRPDEIRNQVNAPDFDTIFSRIEQKTYSAPAFTKFSVYRLVAGIAILVGLAASLYFIFPQKTAVKQLKFATSAGEVKSFTLPDGTLLWLGENSQVVFPENFSESRILDMEGLAFYHVLKNNTPFKVNAGALSVEVTGTSFSVSNYPGTKNIEATLVEGVVNITDSNGLLIKQLKPNEKFIFNKAAGSFQLSEVNARELTLWKEPKLSFDNKSLGNIATELSERYGIFFQVKETATAYNFTFSLSDETLSETLSLISSMAPVKATLTGDTVVFSKRN